MFFEILELCTQVRDLNEYVENDVYIYRPNILVLDNFKKVVIRAYTYLGKAPITAKVTSDRKGGLVVDWTMPVGTYVKYYIPNSGDTILDYVFVNTSDKILNPDSSLLLKYLSMLK